MAGAKGDIEAVKEWLSSEVRLDRYADKLESNGFTTLELCCTITENDLDKMQIVLPYHRKRFLKFAEELKEKLGLAITNGEDSVSSNTELTSHGSETGNEQQGLLIDLDSEEHFSGSSLPSEDINSGDVSVPELPPKKKSSLKLPPPIPPRADLEEVEPSDKRSQAESTQAENLNQVLLPEKPAVQPQQQPKQQEQQQQQPEIPAKRAPVKPPRRNIAKQSSGNVPEIIPKTDTQTAVQEQHAISSISVESDNTAVLVDLSEEREAVAQANSTSANLELCEPEGSDANKIPSGEEGNEERTMPQIEPKRPAPKAPERVPSTKPVPKPRNRFKSEDGVLVSNLLHKDNTASDSKGDFSTRLNNTIEKRPQSFSSPGRRFDPSDGKPSTMPRAATTRRPAPPLPPTRQTGSSSVRTPDKKEVPHLPQPAGPVVENTENQQLYHLVGAPQPGVHQGVFRPVADQPEAAEGDTEPQSSIYEEVCSKGDRKKSYDMMEVDYESDESLDGIFDDLPELGKSRGDSVDSVGSVGEDSSRMSKNILSPRVRKSEGYLWKQGGQKNNKGWRKRWFVFDGKDLRYYKDKDSLNESLHIIPVSQVRDIEIVKDEKRATFKVITPNRIFILASENITDMNLWSQTLMEAIISYKGDSTTWKSGGEMCEPDKEGWLKKQGHNVVADWRKRYVVVKGDKICYYDTYEDFIYSTPINCINAALAKVKMVEGHKNRFVIITFNKSYSFQGDSEPDAASWIVAIETAIQIGLGDRTILEKVWENPNNRFCADCGMKDPVWASVNFFVCVCAKCIGFHRNLGAHCSRARSLLMDEKIWNPTLVELMIKIGNDKANQLLEHKLPEDDKITPDSDVSERREFIYSKYWEKKYCKYHQAFGDADYLGKFLRETVMTEDIMTTMELIFNKVDVRYVPSDAEDEKTPLELAEEAGQTLQAELLRQNGGEGGKLEDLPATINNEAPQSVAVEVYEKEGFLYKKEGNWRKKWFLLKDRHLKYARGPHDKDDLVTIDLRTVTSLVKCPKGELLQLDIVTVDKTHSLKADTEEELDGWYSTLRSKQVFGVLLSQQELGSDGIPHLVAKCLQFVETYGGLEMEGVYRVNGGQLTMKKLRTSFDQDARSVLLTLDECGVHDVTGVLKQYLRQLPDPVIPGTMYKQFIDAGKNQDHNTKLQTHKALINQLPKVNHDTLKAIVFHLTKVVQLDAVNKMKLSNVAMIFGPTLMSNENTGRMDDASINLEFSIVGDMITYYQWLFDVGDEEVEKDRKIKDASQKIRELIELKEKSQNLGNEFTLDIYVKEKNDSPCRPKVSSEMTAGRLCAEIVAQKNLSRDTDWVLFEVIENGAMERAFQVREKVMAAANWGSGNYLIVKENYIAEQIAPYVGSMLTIEGALHMRDPKSKSWKQSHVYLKNGYMLVSKERGSIFKGFKSDKSDAEQWPLHKLTLYVGVPAEKAAKGVDTSCGFTVVVKTDQEDIVRYMCVKDKADMNRWLASILNMKHPEGIWSDPSQREAMARYSIVDPRDTQAEDSPLYLGRQSVHLRRKGSSKHIVEELKFKQRSLKRPVDRGPPT